MTTAKMFRKVEVTLSDAQVLKLGEEAAELELEKEKLEDELEAYNESCKDGKKRRGDAIEKVSKRVRELSHKVDARKDHVDVEVKQMFDNERKLVLIVRADDERQILEQKPMNLLEMAEAKKRDLEQEKAADEPDDEDEPSEGDDEEEEEEDAEDDAVVEDDYAGDEQDATEPVETVEQEG